MKSESSLRLTSLSALLVIFVGPRLHALGEIIAHQLENPCASWLNDLQTAEAAFRDGLEAIAAAVVLPVRSQ
jgi:hypothetical protein